MYSDCLGSYTFVLYKDSKGNYQYAKNLEDYRNKMIKELDDISLEIEYRSKDIVERTNQLMMDSLELYKYIQEIKRRYE